MNTMTTSRSEWLRLLTLILAVVVIFLAVMALVQQLGSLAGMSVVQALTQHGVVGRMTPALLMMFIVLVMYVTWKKKIMYEYGHPRRGSAILVAFILTLVAQGITLATDSRIAVITAGVVSGCIVVYLGSTIPRKWIVSIYPYDRDHPLNPSAGTALCQRDRNYEDRSPGKAGR